jgi:hypothetical protein
MLANRLRYSAGDFDHPTVVGSAVSTLVLAASSSTAPGTYALTVAASTLGVTRAASLTVSITTPPAGPHIGLELSPAALSVMQGNSAAVVVASSPGGGYSGIVTLAVTGVPAGVVAEFDPPRLRGLETSRLHIEARAGAPGKYVLTVTGSGVGVASESAHLVLTILPPPAPAIAVWALGDGNVGNPFIWTVQGDTWTWEVGVARAGYSGVVDLTIEGLPPNVTVVFTPASLDANTTRSELALTAAANASPGETTATIRARGNGVADATFVVRVVVFPPA